MTKMADESSSTPAPATVEVTSEGPKWADFLAGRDDATIYHDPRWGELFNRVYGLKPYYLTAMREGRVTGILQLVEQKSLFFGHHLCSLPWFDASGILAQTADDADALIARAHELRGQTGAMWVELRQERPLAQELPSRQDKVTMLLALPGDSDTLWEGFKAKVRNQVRKAQKADMRSEAEPAGGVEIFYDVYSATMRGLGSPCHSKRFFREMGQLFAEEMLVFAVKTPEDAAVAVSLALRDGQVLRNPWAGSDWSFRAQCPNMLNYWGMLSWACENGMDAFDFGRSSQEAGTHRFKKQWGAEEVQLHWQFVMDAGQSMPDLNPESGKYKTMVACWRKLPLWLTRLLGPRIIRKLS
jgi:FemAB-related protein (PEP-CTERM system-associated)